MYWLWVLVLTKGPTMVTNQQSFSSTNLESHYLSLDLSKDVVYNPWALIEHVKVCLGGFGFCEWGPLVLR